MVRTDRKLKRTESNFRLSIRLMILVGRVRSAEDDARRRGSGAPALPLAGIADRDLLEPDAVVLRGARDVQVAVDGGEHRVAGVPVGGQRGPAPRGAGRGREVP